VSTKTISEMLELVENLRPVSWKVRYAAADELAHINQQATDVWNKAIAAAAREAQIAGDLHDGDRAEFRQLEDRILALRRKVETP